MRKRRCARERRARRRHHGRRADDDALRDHEARGPATADASTAASTGAPDHGVLASPEMTSNERVLAVDLGVAATQAFTVHGRYEDGALVGLADAASFVLEHPDLGTMDGAEPCSPAVQSLALDTTFDRLDARPDRGAASRPPRASAWPGARPSRSSWSVATSSCRPPTRKADGCVAQDDREVLVPPSAGWRGPARRDGSSHVAADVS